MNEFFKKFTSKDALYVAGALASLIALAYVFGKKTYTTDGTISDTPNPAVASPSGATISSPGYTTYNMPPLVAQPLVPPGDTPAGQNGCGCPSAYGCAGASQLDTGDAYTNVSQLLDFYKETNPFYLEAQQAQLNTYASYFATAQTYNSGAAGAVVPNS